MKLIMRKYCFTTLSKKQHGEKLTKAKLIKIQILVLQRGGKKKKSHNKKMATLEKNS